MNEITLTHLEKATLEIRHKETKEGRERDRLKTVLLRSEDWSISMIAQALRVHDTTITRHLSDYANDKLTSDNGGSKSHLDEEQTEELIAHIESQLYHHTHQIVAFVQSKWKIKYSVPGMNKWLHANGFSYKKPKGFPHKADEQKQAAFRAKYKRLKNKVAPNEPILFIDAVHPTQATKLSYGWIKTGADKMVKTTGSRTRLNIVGAIRLGHLSEAVVSDYDTINQESIIDFLSKVREAYTDFSTIHLVLDGAGYHKADNVLKHAKKLNIKLHFLPPYSPNLNPIERLWKVMNEQVRNNEFFSNAKEFKEKIRNFFKKTLSAIADTLNDRINDNFQKLH